MVSSRLLTKFFVGKEMALLFEPRHSAMNSINNAVIKLISNKINHIPSISLKDIDIEELLSVLQKNKLLSFVYMEDYKLSNDLDDDTAKIIELIYERCKAFSLSHIYKEKTIINDLKYCYIEGLNPIVFKGPIISSLYDNSYERVFSDIDILVKEEEYTAIKEKMVGRGYNCYKQKDNVDVLTKGVCVIELHKRIWEDFSGDKISKLESLGVTDPRTFITKKIYDVDVLTLGYTQQLIYYVYHFVKHFVLEGTNIRSLVDFTYYINAEYEKIDFNMFWSAMDALGYTYFISNVFDYCIRKFNMKSIILKSRTNENVEECIVEDLLVCGRYKEEDNSHWDLMRYMSDYLCNSTNKKKFQIQMQVLFPKNDFLNEKYSYAKKYPFLLPIAYFHRVWNYLIKLVKKNKSYSTMDKYKKLNGRFELAKKCKLL